MKAITIWEPWASLIAAGIKQRETRGWSPPARYCGQRIAIHAAKSVKGLQHLTQDPALRQLCADADISLATIRLGCIVCTAEISGWLRITNDLISTLSASERCCGDYAIGRYAWRLTAIRRLPEPIPCTGAQGFFDLPTHVLAQVLA